VVDLTDHDRSGLLLSSSPVPSDEDINQAELVGIVLAVIVLDTGLPNLSVICICVY
jgi:hypothetical protein